MNSISKLSAIDDLISSDEDGVSGMMMGREKKRKIKRKKLSREEYGLLKPLYDDSFRSEEILLNIFSFLRNVKLYRVGFVNRRIREISSSNLLWRDRVDCEMEVENDTPLRSFWARERLITNVLSRRKMDNICDDALTVVFSMMDDKQLFRMGWVSSRLRDLSSKDFVWESRMDKEEKGQGEDETKSKGLAKELQTPLGAILDRMMEGKYDPVDLLMNEAFDLLDDEIMFERTGNPLDRALDRTTDEEKVEKYGDKVRLETEAKSLRDQFFLDWSFLNRVKEMEKDDQKSTLGKAVRKSQNGLRFLLLFRAQRCLAESFFSILPFVYDIFILICFMVLLILYISVYENEDERDSISLAGFILYPSQLVLGCCLNCCCCGHLFCRFADLVVSRRFRNMTFPGEHDYYLRRLQRKDKNFKPERVKDTNKPNEWVPLTFTSRLFSILKFFFFTIFAGLHYGDGGTFVCIYLLWFCFGCCLCSFVLVGCGFCCSWVQRFCEDDGDGSMVDVVDWDEDEVVTNLLRKSCKCASGCFPLCSTCFFMALMPGMVLVCIFFFYYTRDQTDEWYEAIYVTTIVIMSFILVCCPCWCILRSLDLGKILTVGFEKDEKKIEGECGMSRYRRRRLEKRRKSREKYFSEDCAFFPYLDLLCLFFVVIVWCSLLIPFLILFLAGDPSSFEDETISYWYIPFGSFVLLIVIFLCCVCCCMSVSRGFKIHKKAKKSKILEMARDRDVEGFDIGILDPKGMTLKLIKMLKQKIWKEEEEEVRLGSVLGLEEEEEDEVHNPFSKLDRNDFSDVGISDEGHDIFGSIVTQGSLAKQMLKMAEEEEEYTMGTIDRLAHEMVDVGKLESLISSDDDDDDDDEEVVVEQIVKEELFTDSSSSGSEGKEDQIVELVVTDESSSSFQSTDSD